MYAVISDRSRQFKVQVGDQIICDDLDWTEDNRQVTFDEVLLVSNEGQVRLGKPTVEGARVTAEVIGQATGEKLVVFKYRRRKDSRSKRGHRQHYTKVRITGIEA